MEIKGDKVVLTDALGNTIEFAGDVWLRDLLPEQREVLLHDLRETLDANSTQEISIDRMQIFVSAEIRKALERYQDVPKNRKQRREEKRLQQRKANK